MERAIGSLRDRAEEIARETMERRQEQRALEEEARAQYERKMTIYEDAESDPLDELRFPPGWSGEVARARSLWCSIRRSRQRETLVEEPDEVAEAPTERPPRRSQSS